MTKTLKKMDMTIESDVWYKVMLEITVCQGEAKCVKAISWGLGRRGSVLR